MPQAGIFDNPSLGICINREWLPFISGAIEVLTTRDYWPAATDTQTSQIERLIARLQDHDFTEECIDDGEISSLAVWTHTFDFTLSAGGWSARNPDLHDSYVAGVGWFSGCNGGPGDEGTQIVRDFSLTTLTYFEMHVTMLSPAGTSLTDMYIDPSNIQIWSRPGASGGFTEFEYVQVDANHLQASAFTSVGSGCFGSCVIDRIVISGLGTDPF